MMIRLVLTMVIKEITDVLELCLWTIVMRQDKWQVYWISYPILWSNQKGGINNGNANLK
jgi:hypothetical protein